MLADKEIVAIVYEALAKRRPKSHSPSRYSAPAEIVMRLLVLKHIRNWSFSTSISTPGQWHQLFDAMVFNRTLALAPLGRPTFQKIS